MPIDPILAATEAGSAAPLDEHQVLVFLVQLLLLVAVARLLGAAVKRVGQPAVVGELLAGVLLGPSVFARVAPDAYNWVFPDDAVVEGLLFGLAWLGVIMLLVVIGFETDLAIIRRFRRAALYVVAGSLLVPFIGGSTLGFLAPESFIGEAAGDRAVFALLFATALSVSALPVIAKILADLNYLRRNFGQITLAAGMAMDGVGWLLLAAFSGIALQGGVHLPTIGVSVAGLIIFLVLSATVGRWMLDQLYRRSLAEGGSVTAALSITLLAALAAGAVTQALRLEAILGAFIAGILIGSVRHHRVQVRSMLENFTAGFFAPIFFAISGLRVDLGTLQTAEALRWMILVLAAAFLAKVLGTYAGARLGGLSGREGMALGTGLAALGAMGIVVAIVALNLGVFNETSYTIVVVTAIVTSVFAPVGLRWVVKGWETPPEERERLEREMLRQSSVILGGRRALLPTRGGRNSEFAAQLLAAAFDDLEVTILVVDSPGLYWWQRLLRRRAQQASAPQPVKEALGDLAAEVRRKVHRDPVAAIAAESALGYDLLVMGASDAPGGDGSIFSSIVDRTLAEVDIPALVVRYPIHRPPRPGLPRKILVPVQATMSTRAAEEFAYSLARAADARVLALHVVDRLEGQGLTFDEARPDLASEAGQAMLATAVSLGARLGVSVDPRIRVGPHAEAEIVELASAEDFDLLVLGASRRPLTNRPFLGHTSHYILDNAETAVVVVSLPAFARLSGDG